MAELEVPEHRPGFYAGLLERLERETRNPKRPVWAHPYAVTAAAALVATVVLAASLLSTGGTGPSPVAPRLVTAAAVRARVATALASISSLRGTLTVECAVPYGACEPQNDAETATRAWKFVVTAAGDEHVVSVDTAEGSAFTVSDRTYREVVGVGSAVQAAEIRNVGAGPPDAFVRSPLRRNFASAVRAVLNERGTSSVRTTRERGRPVWQLSMPVVPNKLAGPGASGDRLDVAVDTETGFPLRITESLRGATLHEVRLSELQVDVPAAADELRLQFPAGARVFRQDAGFQPVSVDAAATTVGYRPLLPTALPGGFELAEITAAATGPATGNEGTNPAAPGVVSVAYRRGFDRIIVSTRLRGGAPRCAGDGTGATACWADPVAAGEGLLEEPEEFEIDDGALAGTRGELLLSPRGIPHVWVLGARFVVTVAGDASRAELLRIVNSFGAARAPQT